jgi:hypothetical protein
MQRRAGIVLGLVGACVLAGGSTGAQALEWLHSQRTEGNKVCMSDHFHSGTSSGQPTRQAAEREAIANWAGFTAFEYGDRWGRWSLAGSKRVNCSQSGSGWGCELEGRPCRLNIGAAARRAKSN